MLLPSYLLSKYLNEADLLRVRTPLPGELFTFLIKIRCYKTFFLHNLHPHLLFAYSHPVLLNRAVCMEVFENQHSMARKHFSIVKVFHSSSSHDITDPQPMHLLYPTVLQFWWYHLIFVKNFFRLPDMLTKNLKNFLGQPSPNIHSILLSLIKNAPIFNNAPNFI